MARFHGDFVGGPVAKRVQLICHRTRYPDYARQSPAHRNKPRPRSASTRHREIQASGALPRQSLPARHRPAGWRSRRLYQQRIARYPCVSNRASSRSEPSRGPAKLVGHTLRAAGRNRRRRTALLNPRNSGGLHMNLRCIEHAAGRTHAHHFFRPATLKKQK